MKYKVKYKSNGNIYEASDDMIYPKDGNTERHTHKIRLTVEINTAFDQWEATCEEVAKEPREQRMRRWLDQLVEQQTNKDKKFDG